MGGVVEDDIAADTAGRQLGIEGGQLGLGLVPGPALVHTDEDVIAAQGINEIEYGRAPVVADKGGIVPMEGGDVYTFLLPGDIKGSRRSVEVGDSALDAEGVEERHKEEEEDDKLNSSGTEETAEGTSTRGNAVASYGGGGDACHCDDDDMKNKEYSNVIYIRIDL